MSLSFSMSHNFHNLEYDNLVLNRQTNRIALDTFHPHDHQNATFMAREIELPNFHLKICSIIQPAYYTGIIIPVEVVLIDPATGDVAKCHEAIEVEIVVLVEKFDFGDDQEWTAEYFSSKIADGKDGRCLLRENNRRVFLKDGVGYIEVLFKHSRSWFGKCKYRFGARVVGHYNTKLREAKTEPFSVQDRRCMSKRDKALQLSAKIWEIKGIGKKGPLAHLLIRRNIVTVKDFLVEYNLYLHRLKQIFVETKFLNKWEAICEHALSCQIDKKMYLYSSPEPQQTSVVFNSVGELLGMIFEEDRYISIEDISESEKARARELVAAAFHEWKDVKPYIPEKKRQQAEDVYIPFYSRDTGESSCSCAVKRQRTSERDPATERASTDKSFGEGDMNDLKIDSLSPDNTPSSGVNFDWLDCMDTVDEQPWSPYSGVEGFLSNATTVDGEVEIGEECLVLDDGVANTSESQPADDVYSLWRF